MIKKHFIIVEDEVRSGEMLRDLFLDLRPEWKMLAHLKSIEETIAWFQNNPQPDLVFMDIELADGNCFSIFNTITITGAIIFTTAYSEFALKAFEQNSIDYLLKPIKEKELGRAICKFEQILDAIQEQSEAVFDYQHLAKLLTAPTVYRQRFIISKRESFYKLDVKDIAYLYFDNRITFAVTFSNEHRMISQSLDKTEQELDPALFFRANRQTIIHIEAVDHFESYFGGKLAVKLTNPAAEKVIISQAKATAFKEWLNS